MSILQIQQYYAKVEKLIRYGGSRNELQRQIGATDREIDRLVYDLYSLTDEEIAVLSRGHLRRGVWPYVPACGGLNRFAHCCVECDQGGSNVPPNSGQMSADDVSR